jgi:hypothetical protein
MKSIQHPMLRVAKYISPLLFVCILANNNKALAQTDTIRTDIIDVVKPFKAVLSEAIKIPSNPNPEVPEISTPEIGYNIPVMKHNDIPTIYTIKPLALGTQLLPKTKNNYTRVGFGNFQMPLFEVYLNSKRNRDYQLGAFFKHLSADGGNFQQFSNNTASLYGKRFIDAGVIDVSFLYHRNINFLYGANTTTRTFTSNELRNSFELIDANAGFGNVQKDADKFKYNLKLNYYNYATNVNVSENNFSLAGDFKKSFDGNPLNVHTAVQQNITRINGADYNRIFVDINPDYLLNISERLKIKIGFNSTFFGDSNGVKLHFFPKADVAFQVIPKALTLYGGITGSLQRHTLRSITTENPFVRSLTLENTLNQFETYGGLRGVISPQTSFTLQASYATVRNLLFYGADSNLFSQNTIYEPVASGLTRIQAELNHDFNNRFHFAFSMNYFGYDLSINAPYSRPTFTTATNLWYNISDKFLIRTEVFSWNRRTVLVNDSVEEALKGFADLNLGFEYRYSKTVGLFINFNNITNNRYERWLNLPVYGFNVLGGLGITF